MTGDIEREFAAAAARHQAGDFAGAERAYREILARATDHVPTLCNLGTILSRNGDADGAADCYRKALAVRPGYPDAHFNLGNVLRRAGRLPEAAAEYQACLRGNPGHVGAKFNLGLTYAAAGAVSAAADCFRSATRLDPADHEAPMRLGDALLRAGNPSEALDWFRRATELRPTDPRTWYNFGLGLSAAGLGEQALAALRRALELRPDYPEAHNALGMALEGLGRKDEANAHYQRSVQLSPGFADAWSNLAINLCEQGRVDEALVAARHAVGLRPGAANIHSNLVLLTNYSSRLTPDEVYREHLDWAERHAGPTPDPPPIAEPHDPTRRLRVGYLSADFRGHTVAGFIELLLTHHDRRQVEVFAYASVPRPDETTERLKGLADQWRPVSGLSDAELAERIRADGIDVLIDLGGHTASNRLLAMARRPAPVQATVFGYPNTTGMAAVDYRITDGFSDPPGVTDHLSAERLLRLPDVAWVYKPPAVAPGVSPLPSAAGNPFTFGCMKNPAKCSDACLSAWARLLRETPDSVLVLLAGQSEAAARRIAERFVAEGVHPDRVRPLPRLPADRYFATYGQIDLALDPFPYNGGVTTCDALWMGVPVLAVAGNTYVSRQGAGIMTRLGMPEFVAADLEQLVGLARHWANCRIALAVVRAGLRDRLAASAICDAPRYVANLEAELRRVWRERLPPAVPAGER